MSKNNGGAAFPMATIDGYTQDGMTLRDYFAAKVVAALITEPQFTDGSRAAVELWDDRDDGNHGPEQFAYVAYRVADAMLKAREA
jgi:hypothetical protein